MCIDQKLYRKAFKAYLRKGTPIERSIKQDRPTTHYIWRTRGDDDVRPSHAANNGRVFAWSNPPPTKNPGEDYGCRCTAEPYRPDLQESVAITLRGVSDSGTAWSSRDFVRHYYRGRGRGVTVRQTGHLRSIVSECMRQAESRIIKHIAKEARQSKNGTFSDTFYRTYNMTGVVFSIGDTTIGGRFSGIVSEEMGVLKLSGALEFYLRDKFADPLDIGVDVFDLGRTIFENFHRPLDSYLRGQPRGPIDLGIQKGKPYAITDAWSGRFDGKIYSDASRSVFN